MHSFKIGTITSAKQAGISIMYIKTLGQWKSDSYLCYIEPPQQLANLSQLLLSKALEHNYR